MALKLTDIGLQRSIEYVLGMTTDAAPGAWLTLFTTGPSHNGVGDVELSGYSRVDLTAWATTVTWPTASTSLTSGYQVVSMPSCTITGWGLSNLDFGGDLLAFELLALPVTFQVGDRYSISPADIVIIATT